MKLYEKVIDGKTVRKTLVQIVVRKNGKQVINPTEEMVLADGWVEYIEQVQEEPEVEPKPDAGEEPEPEVGQEPEPEAPEGDIEIELEREPELDGWFGPEIEPEPIPAPVQQTVVEVVRKKVLSLIEAYDASDNVNVCYISMYGQDIPYWANKLERSSLSKSVRDYMENGHEQYRLDLREVGVSVEVECNQLLRMLSELEVYAIECYNKTTDHIFQVRSLQTEDELRNYDYKEGYPEKLTFNF